MLVYKSTMKSRILIISALFCVFFNNNINAQISGPWGCPYTPAVPMSNGVCLTGDWKLVFEDEFIGTEIDHNKWFTLYRDGARCREADAQVYLDENVSVNDGILKLTFNENPGDYECGHRDYAGGLIWSQESYLYGIFEAEIKIPSGNGFFPAFWLFGEGGEIDIFEFRHGNETKPEFTTHKWFPDTTSIRCTYEHTGIDYSHDYHIYTVYWDPYFIAFFIDSDLIYTHWLWYTLEGQPIDCDDLNAGVEYALSESYPNQQNEEFIVLNIAAEKNETPGPLPNEMLVKYVRAWQLKEDICIDKTINQFTSSYIEGKSITVDGNITVGSNEDITLIAHNSIYLKKGLHIENGASFNAKTNPNLCPGPILKSEKVNIKPTINFDQIDSLRNQYSLAINKSEKDLVMIYPNPVEDILNIYSNKAGELQITDIYGKIIISSTIRNKVNQFDLSELTNGFYFVILKSENRVFKKKFIKI
ncbi:MAG: hypothetical protein Kow0068_01650 [Marinilabiliales bacterium]